MDPSEFTSRVRRIPVRDIEPSSDNPRGEVKEDQSFDRLVSSISQVGILVPILVRQKTDGGYQLVDGERRFLAAKKLRLPDVPAHVLSPEDRRTVRRYMFHLHMTREQWTPLAQCRSLAEMYPSLQDGVKIEDKARWVRKIHEETWMDPGTARDRVHVLAWPRPLKDRIYDFSGENPDRDIYSYVLAIEVSIVEPSVEAFPDYYRDHNKVVDNTANLVRESLFQKTVAGMEVGALTSRDQIRGVAVLFKPGLSRSEQRIAAGIFTNLVGKPRYSYDDARADLEMELPALVAEKPPKPQRLVGMIASLTDTLEAYRVEYIDDTIRREESRSKMKAQLNSALQRLVKAATSLRGGL